MARRNKPRTIVGIADKSITESEIEADINRMDDLPGSHIMIDIETLGTAPGSIITSIGACQFIFVQDAETGNRNTLFNLFSFTKHIDIKDSLDQGGKISKSTLLWWLQQSEEARKDLVSHQDEQAVTVKEALIAFNQWFNDLKQPADETFVWANGAGFDPVLMEYWYRHCQVPIPWAFHNLRCYRTLKALYPLDKPVEQYDTRHTALADAAYQMRTVCAIVEKYKVDLK